MFTRLSKILAALLLTGWAVYFVRPDVQSYLALIPGRTLPYAWNLITAGFFVTSPWEVGRQHGARTPDEMSACSALDGLGWHLDHDQ